MAANDGKVALVNNTTLLSGSCPFGASVVDFVGYGDDANCFEGAGPTPEPNAANAARRLANGCTDTNNNIADFIAAPANPRNTVSPLALCGAPTNPTGTGAAVPNPVPAGNVVLLTVNVTPGANPNSTGLSVTANLTMIGGAAAQLFFDDGTNGDDTAGDNIFSFQTQIPSSVTPGMKTLPVTITDAQSRTGSATINLTVVTPPPPGNVVISQIFGGGGNSDAPFTHDFIELFNRSNAPVSINGYSIQYTSSTGGSWQKVDLSGTLAPGQYFLIQLASSGANGAPLPPPDATGTIVMASTAGKVALVNNTTLLSGSCPFGASVVDFVGYGNAANCFEGLGPAPAPSSERAAFRSGLGCVDNNDNASDFFTAAPQPKNTAAPFNVCGEGARFENLTVTLTDPATCTSSGNVITVAVQFTNSGTSPQGDNPGAEFTAQLPPSLLALSNSCTTLSGACQIISPSQIEWNGAVRINETIRITFQAQVTDSALVGANLCVTGTLNFDSDINGRNDTMISRTGCLATPCAAVGPGLAYPANSAVSDQKAGSVLIYPLYSSITTRLARENARINLTNINPSRRIAVHLFFIEDDGPSVADLYVCLTPNQTVSFLASDVDPDVTGYLVAVASDERTGCPINFNFLIGDEYVKLDSGHAANLAAEAFAALPGAPVVCDENSVTAEINFDGISYNAAPRVLAADSIPSLADGNSTLIVIDRIGGSLATGVSTIGQLFGLFFDDRENGFSFEFPTGRRQFRGIISNTLPRTTPRVSELLATGHTGWMKFSRASDGGIIGALINFNPDTAAKAGAFNQGHNLHKLTLTTEASFTVPVFPPNC